MIEVCSIERAENGQTGVDSEAKSPIQVDIILID
jgi:hypothetical protein